jgi:anti-sigma-K factor RskA
MDPREKDDALRKMLETWQPGQPSPELDRRAMQSFRAVTGAPQSKTAWRQRVWWRYGAVAACMATGVTVAVWLAPHARHVSAPLRMDSVLEGAPQGTAYDTQVDSSAFRPVADAKIVVIVKGDGR